MGIFFFVTKSTFIDLKISLRFEKKKWGKKKKGYQVPGTLVPVLVPGSTVF
jgi:hypothetical protein